MGLRHARGHFVAALVAILLNAFAPAFHAVIHADSLAPNTSARLAANGESGKSQDAPGKQSNEAQCPLGQALPSVGPALAPSGEAFIAFAALGSTVEALPAQSLDGIAPPRPSSRGPPEIEA